MNKDLPNPPAGIDYEFDLSRAVKPLGCLKETDITFFDKALKQKATTSTFVNHGDNMF